METIPRHLMELYDQIGVTNVPTDLAHYATDESAPLPTVPPPVRCSPPPPPSFHSQRTVDKHSKEKQRSSKRALEFSTGGFTPDSVPAGSRMLKRLVIDNGRPPDPDQPQSPKLRSPSPKRKPTNYHRHKRLLSNKQRSLINSHGQSHNILRSISKLLKKRYGFASVRNRLLFSQTQSVLFSVDFLWFSCFEKVYISYPEKANL